MAFKQLTINDIRNVLSEDEVQSLDNLSLAGDKTTIINDIVDIVADSWRGALQAKGYTLDIREHYIPSEYVYWVLVHARWAIWTRFNMSPAIGLDDARKEEYQKALELLKNPYIGIAKPDYQYDPTNPANGGSGDAAIKVPFLRFDESLYLNIAKYSCK